MVEAAIKSRIEAAIELATATSTEFASPAGHGSRPIQPTDSIFGWVSDQCVWMIRHPASDRR